MELQVGDVANLETDDERTLIQIDRLGWHKFMTKEGAIYLHDVHAPRHPITVHRPTPEGLVQVFPTEVKG